MKYDGWQKDGVYTPLDLWIEFRPGEPIPDELKFEGWQTSIGIDDGNVPITRWFANRLAVTNHDEIPEPVPADMFFEGWE